MIGVLTRSDVDDIVENVGPDLRPKEAEVTGVWTCGGSVLLEGQSVFCFCLCCDTDFDCAVDTDGAADSDTVGGTDCAAHCDNDFHLSIHHFADFPNPISLQLSSESTCFQDFQFSLWGTSDGLEVLRDGVLGDGAKHTGRVGVVCDEHSLRVVEILDRFVEQSKFIEVLGSNMDACREIFHFVLFQDEPQACCERD
ncbi:hypothetical protein WICPIJ_004519 [Wickerhamomyces pijperi]|uniref:Uncharacterized protein n=1 Tax=Wickerhamomyces pijperi TaxID=599730 RepID=A0A9P8Q7H8_WICPI|nr:hypothetical protein WICPIJ_004519 [Wickerhamomyces pijperi]